VKGKDEGLHEKAIQKALYRTNYGKHQKEKENTMRTISISPIYVIRQFERGIVEIFGKYTGFVEPGIHYQLPFVNITRIRDVREHTMDITPQHVITKDNVEIEVDGLIWVRPGLSAEEIRKTFYNIDNWKVAVIQLAKTHLRQEIGSLTLDESLTARERISKNLKEALDILTKEWGLKVCKLEIKLIDPPRDIKQAMHKEKTAEQDRRAMKLLATGKFEASKQEKLALIQIAEGQREAEIHVAEGKAKAIELVNQAASKYFIGHARELKQLEVTQASLENNTKVVLTDKGISPQIILGELPLARQNSQQSGKLAAVGGIAGKG
jgi:regulator of protease activity HflC (stomatin/prohibitin superfamily)